MKQKILAFLFYILPHHAISRLMFIGARIQWTPLKNFIIRTYTSLHPVKMSDAIEEDMFAYASLNAFFTRALKAESRPFDNDEKKTGSARLMVLSVRHRQLKMAASFRPKDETTLYLNLLAVIKT